MSIIIWEINYNCCRLEATFCGCLPLVPNALVYPEMYPKSCLYEDLDDLHNILVDLCDNPQKSIELRHKLDMDFTRFSEDQVLPKFMNVLEMH